MCHALDCHRLQYSISVWQVTNRINQNLIESGIRIAILFQTHVTHVLKDISAS